MQNDDLHNKLVNAVGKQFHTVADPYISVNLSVMDSVVACRLNNRHIYPGYVATETIDSEGKVIKANPATSRAATTCSLTASIPTRDCHTGYTRDSADTAHSRKWPE